MFGVYHNIQYIKRKILWTRAIVASYEKLIELILNGVSLTRPCLRVDDSEKKEEKRTKMKYTQWNQKEDQMTPDINGISRFEWRIFVLFFFFCCCCLISKLKWIVSNGLRIGYQLWSRIKLSDRQTQNRYFYSLFFFSSSLFLLVRYSFFFFSSSIQQI